MNMKDFEKAAQIAKPYQDKIRAILGEYKQEMAAEFGDSFNASVNFNLHPMFLDSKENAAECGFKFGHYDDYAGYFFWKTIDDIELTIVDHTKHGEVRD